MVVRAGPLGLAARDTLATAATAELQRGSRPRMVIFDGSALHCGAVGLVCGLARGLGLPLLYDDEGCADLSPLAAQARPPFLSRAFRCVACL